MQPGVGITAARAAIPIRCRTCPSDAARAAHAARHRLRARQPLQALHPIRRKPAELGVVRQRPQRAFRQGRLRRLSEAACVRCALSSRHRADFDEVFVGFRLAPWGAQDYFGVKADMVTYGKTLGGGLPIGVGAAAPGPHERLSRGFARGLPAGRARSTHTPA